MNLVVMSGNIASDVESREINGKYMARFNIAVKNPFKKGKDGSKGGADFFKVVMWGNTAESAKTHLAKGKGVEVRGKIVNKEYEANNGEKKRYDEIEADQWNFPPSSGNGESKGAASGKPASKPQPTKQPEPSYEDEYYEDPLGASDDGMDMGDLNIDEEDAAAPAAAPAPDNDLDLDVDLDLDI
jgi:single-strand DNA-binding protein